jgi:lysophospholipase L1-like esterase
MKWIHNLTLSLGSLAVAAIVLESALRFAMPIPDPYDRYKLRSDRVPTYIPSQFPRNLSLRTQSEPGLPGMPGEARFSTNNYGFRGDSLVLPKPADELRIFMVGGSTTESLYLDDLESVTRVLQDSLQARVGDGRKVRVYGAGKSGDKSFDHLSMIAHRIVHLQPDLIIVFSGINDVVAGLVGRDYLHYGRIGDGTPSHWSLPQLLRFSATEFQLGRLVFAALQSRSYQDTLQEITMTSGIRRAVETRRSLPVASTLPDIDVSPYERNLRSIVGVAQVHEIELAFVTQATTWNSDVDAEAEEWQWMNLGLEVSYPAEAMDRVMESYNDAMRELARTHSIPLLDLPKWLPKSLEYFYDDVHFNRKGAAATGAMLARFLVDECSAC